MCTPFGVVHVNSWIKKRFANKDVARYINEHYYAVKFNAEGNEEIAFYDRCFAIPIMTRTEEEECPPVHTNFRD